MNEKNSQERLEALVAVVAGLFHEAQQRLEEKKAEHLESTVTMSGRVDQAFKKYQEATEALKNIENEGTDKAVMGARKAEKAAKEVYDKLSHTLESYSKPGKVEKEKQQIRDDVIQANREVLVSPLFKGKPLSLNAELSQHLENLLAAQAQDNPEKSEFIRSLVSDVVHGALYERVETKNNLLVNRDDYYSKSGFDVEIYRRIGVEIREGAGQNDSTGDEEKVRGLLTLDGKAEFQVAGQLHENATNDLKEVMQEYGVVNPQIATNIDSGNFDRAVDGMYKELSVPESFGASGDEERKLLGADRLYKACQSNAARALLVPELGSAKKIDFHEVHEHYETNYFDSDAKDDNFRGSLIHTAGKSIDFIHQLDVPNKFVVGAALLPEGNKKAIQDFNEVKEAKAFTELFIKQVGQMKGEKEGTAIVLLNLMSAAYPDSSVKNAKDFFNSESVRGVIQQLVSSNPDVMKNKEFVDGLIRFNKMADKPLNLGKDNNALLEARNQVIGSTSGEISHSIIYPSMSKELSSHFEFSPDDSAVQKKSSQFLQWLNSPSIRHDLVNPDQLSLGSAIPDLIEFKDGGKILREGDDMVLTGFSAEKLNSFRQASFAKSLEPPKVVSTDPKFQAQVARELELAQVTPLSRKESRIISQRLSQRMRTVSQLPPVMLAKGRIEVATVAKAEASIAVEDRARKVTFAPPPAATEEKSREPLSPRSDSDTDSSMSPRSSGDEHSDSEDSLRGSPRTAKLETPISVKVSVSKPPSQKNSSEARTSSTSTQPETEKPSLTGLRGLIAQALKYTTVGMLIEVIRDTWNKSKVAAGEQPGVATKTGQATTANEAKGKEGVGPARASTVSEEAKDPAMGAVLNARERRKSVGMIEENAYEAPVESVQRAAVFGGKKGVNVMPQDNLSLETEQRMMGAAANTEQTPLLPREERQPAAQAKAAEGSFFARALQAVRQLFTGAEGVQGKTAAAPPAGLNRVTFVGSEGSFYENVKQKEVVLDWCNKHGIDTKNVSERTKGSFSQYGGGPWLKSDKQGNLVAGGWSKEMFESFLKGPLKETVGRQEDERPIVQVAIADRSFHSEMIGSKNQKGVLWSSENNKDNKFSIINSLLQRATNALNQFISMVTGASEKKAQADLTAKKVETNVSLPSHSESKVEPKPSIVRTESKTSPNKVTYVKATTLGGFKDAMTVIVAIGTSTPNTIEKAVNAHFGAELKLTPASQGAPGKTQYSLSNNFSVTLEAERLVFKLVNPSESQCKKAAALIKDLAPGNPQEAVVKGGHGKEEMMVSALKTQNINRVKELPSAIQTEKRQSMPRG
jgi:hypothetical protein